MAEIEVQPKKKSSILPWVLLALGLIALIYFLTRNGKEDGAATAATTTDTLNNASGNAAMNTDGWADVDFNAPRVNYDEITNRDIDVRGNNSYGIYGIGENILFDENKATLRAGAEQNLQQITASISKRYNSGNIRVYGYTDAQGSAGYNKELAEQRAEAVRNWLVQHGNIAENQISLHPAGEANPVASNATEQGRQQNRRVEIVARGTGNAATGSEENKVNTGEQPNM
jgi:outer membrane protein OmpA-like peptidoglycan-associated protein